MNARVDPRDQVATTEWAIAAVASAGIFAGYNAFALMNRVTGKGYTLHIPSAGLSVGVSASAGEPTFVYFRTKEPVTATAFHGVNARITSANVGVFYGYSITYLTLRKTAWGWSDTRAYVKFTGTGVMLPGGGVSAGVTIMSDGSPCSLRGVAMYLDIKLDPDEPIVRDTRIQFTPKEDKKSMVIEADAAFAFDSHELNKNGEKVLEKCAYFLNMRKKERVTIIGHTDSIGEDDYNMRLSERRAETVRKWFEAKKTLGARDFNTYGLGESEPIAPNEVNGADNPAGRAKNRRVEIIYN